MSPAVQTVFIKASSHNWPDPFIVFHHPLSLSLQTCLYDRLMLQTFSGISDPFLDPSPISDVILRATLCVNVHDHHQSANEIMTSSKHFRLTSLTKPTPLQPFSNSLPRTGPTRPH